MPTASAASAVAYRPGATAPAATGQRLCHDRLIQHRRWTPIGTARAGQLDAIVVPAARGALSLSAAVQLATSSGTRLVVIASHGCDVVEAAELVAAAPGSWALIMRIQDDGSEAMRLETGADEFVELSAGRSSNLSVKRNLGLKLARLRGWRKIMFLDDDIHCVTPEHLRNVALQLETQPFAGLRTTEMPDNSVVCHANRRVGAAQGVFVSGAALGVNCADLPLQVFPDIYNEDWFAMAGAAAKSGVVCIGDAHQLEFNPFLDPERAAREEFGDVLAEGLFTAMGEGMKPTRTTWSYWDAFITERAALIDRIAAGLLDMATNETIQAHTALARARGQLGRIEADDCLAFLDAWQRDQIAFAREVTRLPSGIPYDTAMEMLGVDDWRVATFAHPDMRAAHLLG